MADINQLVNRAEEFMVKAPYLPLGLAKEMIAALKEQEPVIPKEERLNDVDSIYRCGNCGTHFYYRQQKYCAICGRKAKWDK